MSEHAMFMQLSQDLAPHLSSMILNLDTSTLSFSKGVSLSLRPTVVFVSSTAARSSALLMLSLRVLTEPRPSETPEGGFSGVGLEWRIEARRGWRRTSHTIFTACRLSGPPLVVTTSTMSPILNTFLSACSFRDLLRVIPTQ